MNNIKEILFVAMAWIVFQPMAMAVDTFEVDPNGDYIIRYDNQLGHKELKWVPKNKINPTITGYVNQVTGLTDIFNYSYTLLNGSDSRQFLEGMRLDAQKVTSVNPAIPVNWTGDITLDYFAGVGFIVGWSVQSGAGPELETGIKPGAMLGGFGFNSSALPGMGKIFFWGAAPSGQSFDDYGPEPDSPIRNQVDKVTSVDIFRLGPVPLIVVPSPFNAATVLTDIQKHLNTDLLALKIVDPGFATQLDSWFITGIDAAKLNNVAGLLNALTQARALLKAQYPDIDNTGNEAATDDKMVAPKLIAKLAARALNFDLKYVYAQVAPKDTIPPALALTVKPARLQATVGKLVTIIATVTAKDDVDPAPTIKLESISANEPLAAGDISGAALGTDDRQFQLRDEKVQSGAVGRIYTITYSATDASGNKAMASATVRVK
jgi:hypothetical protein